MLTTARLGRSRLRFSGAVTSTITGFSSATHGGGGLPGWGLILTNANQEAVTILNEGSRPAPGTYPIIDYALMDTGVLADRFVATASFQIINLYGSVSGSLTITSSSDSEMRGTFTYTAASLADPSSTITVNGDFTLDNPPA